MKLKVASILVVGMLAVQANAEEQPVLKTDKDMISYSIGVDIARNLRKEQVDLDPQLLMRGIQDGMGNDRLLLADKEVRRVMNGFRADLRRKMAGERRLAAVDNKKKGDEFLAANKLKDGVVTLSSGVQYKVLKEGSGKRPTDTDRIVCNYRGTLLDGTEFDATEAGKPATLEVARLIPGWKDALRRMPEGSRWQIVVPPQQAYGDRGVGNDIGPNETLLFDVELVAVK